MLSLVKGFTYSGPLFFLRLKKKKKKSARNPRFRGEERCCCRSPPLRIRDFQIRVRARPLFELDHGGAARGLRGGAGGGAGAAALQHRGELRRGCAGLRGAARGCAGGRLLAVCTEACNMLMAVGYARGTISSCFAHHMSGR